MKIRLSLVIDKEIDVEQEFVEELCKFFAKWNFYSYRVSYHPTSQEHPIEIINIGRETCPKHLIT